MLKPRERYVRHLLTAASMAMLASLSVAQAAPAAPAARAAPAVKVPPRPRFIVGPVLVTSFDGVADDLLTAGLGAAGLASATPPPVAEPAKPTPAELRRLAIYGNYRALVDTSPGGGYGVLYGPGVDGPERIAGKEYLTLAKGRDGRQTTSLLVQIPASFDPAHACIIAAPSPGSRGVYGAIATAGEWGLAKGCAVAYTDKGTGVGAEDLDSAQVSLVDGTRLPASEAGARSTFTAALSEARRTELVGQLPHRIAWKHAHSGVNPERSWGRDVIQSLELALWALNREIAASAPTAGAKDGPGAKHRPLTWANTLVIASSVSNGGGAALRAAEEAPRGMIDGVAVSEPNVNPRYDNGFVIRQGSGKPLAAHSRPLLDYMTLVNLYQGCANAGRAYAEPPLATLLTGTSYLANGTCQSLQQLGLLQATTVKEQAAEAQRRINAEGILLEQNEIQPAQWLLAVPQAIAITYANAYARASVADSLCGYSMAPTSPVSPFQPVALDPVVDAQLFGSASGIPPTAGIQLVNNLSINGATRNDVSVSPAFDRQDQNTPGAVCLRSLATGRDVAGAPLTGAEHDFAERIRQSLAQIKATGRLHGIPTVIVQGRADAVLAPNHTARPYYALSRRADGKRSRVRYYEVLNAQHLDSLNAFPDLAARLVPLHVYYREALDLVWARLTRGTPLPPSQVVRTTPRGAAATPLTAADLPSVAAKPAAGDTISFDGKILTIPD